MAVKIIWEERGALIEMSNSLTGGQIIAANEMFYKDERSYDCRYKLFLCIDLCSVEIGPDVIVQTATSDAGASMYLPNIKMVLVTRNPLLLEVFEEYTKISKTINDSWAFKSFDSLYDARIYTESMDEITV